LVADKRLARKLALEAYRKLAFDITLIDVRRKCDYCNHFLVLSGKNRMHLQSLRDHISEQAKERGVECFGRDGAPDSGWIIIDFGPLVVHIFTPDTREYYSIDTIFGDPKIVELDLPDDA